MDSIKRDLVEILSLSRDSNYCEIVLFKKGLTVMLLTYRDSKVKTHNYNYS